MIVYLLPKSPFTKSAPRSDTLFGAICWAIRLLYGQQKLVDIIEKFDAAIESARPLPFLLTSCFPYFQDKQGKIHFLPKPLLPLDGKTTSTTAELTPSSKLKKLKKARYFSSSLFNQLVLGKLTGLHNSNDYEVVADTIVTKEETDRFSLEKLVVETEVARNSINRLSTSTGDEGGYLYYEPIVSSFRQAQFQTGFYFLLRFSDDAKPETCPMIEAALRLLADKGFGGDSSVGRGHCEVTFGDEEIFPTVENPSRLVTLSLLHPSTQDIDHFRKRTEESFAKLEKRKGFIENSYINVARIWKPTLFYFAEGSTFPLDNNRQVYGSLYKDSSERESLDYQLRINGLAYTVGLI